jgi:predicted ATP-dependent endonuclease of OLD family
MQISHIDIQNYRKLKSCRISLSDRETVFVGANNSGKTSAMDALIFFLDPKGKKVQDSDSHEATRKMIASDFTLSNWNEINAFGKSWQTPQQSGTKLVDWQPLCPSIDIWMNVDAAEIHRVSHIIPTLKWNGGMLGVRLIYQPRKVDDLKADFLLEFGAATELLQTAKDKLNPAQQPDSMKLSLWPTTLHNFLDRNLARYFEVKAYIVDPEKFGAVGQPSQILAEESTPLDAYPFNGLFKVDIIDATRGFSDPNSAQPGASQSGSTLASLINKYYKRHLNPSDLPDEDDLEALNAIADAQHIFDEKLNAAFAQAIGEIKNLGYPGFNDPNIRLSSRVDPIDNLDHETGILFDLQQSNTQGGMALLSLSEKYNGLGYKNLIAMVFKLVSFRDHWMRVGKAKKRVEDISVIEPLHLVLIEEPEAHLHAQVQQVFIRKAFEVLRNHTDLGDNTGLRTQLIVSTHSSYLAHEIGFERLRYFKRTPAQDGAFIPIANVVDLAETFGEKKAQSENVAQTAEFVARYLKSTHCDLFFANGVIIVEGAAERMLVPHFIRKHYDGPKGLNRSYISILEVGGAHAHRLKALIEKLELPTLVITDTDALEPHSDEDGKELPATAVRPQKGMGFKTGSHVLKDWIEVGSDLLDDVLKLKDEQKIRKNVRAAYQCQIKVDFIDGERLNAIPYTFEDAIALTNPDLFKNFPKPTGMLKKMQTAFSKATLEECLVALYAALKDDKAAMALDLMFYTDPDDLRVPEYIKEGLDWLQEQLDINSTDVLINLVPVIAEVQ